MIIVDWPVTFPQCFVNDSDQSGPVRNWEEFDTDYGPPLASKRGTAREYEVSGVLRFDVETFNDFESWFENDCGDGSNLLRKGADVFRWADVYRVSKSGNKRYVQVSWLRQPQ